MCREGQGVVNKAGRDEVEKPPVQNPVGSDEAHSRAGFVPFSGLWSARHARRRKHRLVEIQREPGGGFQFAASQPRHLFAGLCSSIVTVSPSLE